MQFTLNRNELKEALGTVKSFVPLKSQIPACENVMIAFDGEKATFTGYNLETGAIAEIPLPTMDKKEILINGSKFTEIVNKLTGENVELELDEANDIITIKCGRSKCKLQYLNADTYPSIPVVDNKNSFTLPQDKLKQMIIQTNFACAVSDNKPILKGELFDIADGDFNLAAIDGYRLAVCNATLDNKVTTQFVVNGVALKAMSKLFGSDGDVTVYYTRRHVLFDMGSTKIFSRLLEGDFHNYKGSIPTTSSTQTTIPVNQLINILERFALLISDNAKAPIRCKFEENQLKLHIKTPLGEMDDILDLEMFGNSVEIGFNCRYLIEALKATESDKTKMVLGNSVSPAKIIPMDGNTYTMLVLPVRLKAGE